MAKNNKFKKMPFHEDSFFINLALLTKPSMKLSEQIRISSKLHLPFPKGHFLHRWLRPLASFAFCIIDTIY